MIIAQEQTIVSGLADVTSPVQAATPSAIAMSTATSANTPGSTTTSTNETVVTTTSSNKGGRPKGSTSSPAKARHIDDATNECSIEIAYLKALDLEKCQKDGKTRRVPRGAFEKSISKICEKYNLERSEIKYNTVLSRNRTGHKLKVQHTGTLSPMVGIKAHLLGIILRRAALRHPVSCAEGLELANSLIEGTAHQLCLIEWKKKYLKKGELDVTFGFLGARYWQNFCRRNHDIIYAKKTVLFDSKRDDWCRYDNFSDMYDDVYGRLHEMGIAKKLSEAVWRDRDNNIVTEADAYGQKTAYSLIPTQAHQLIMVD
jgi:hypothetical protein